MKPCYYIYTHSPNMCRLQYHTLESAVKDAEFMAERYPGITFEVLQVVALRFTRKPYAKKPKPPTEIQPQLKRDKNYESFCL